MGFSPLCLGTVVLTLGSSVNLHIHRLASHHHHKARNDLRLAGDNTEQLGKKWTGIPKGQDTEPTDIISHIAGHRHLQLLKHLCSLFVFVSLCLPCMCLHRYAYIACVCMFFCVCACAWPTSNAEVTVTEHET